MATVTEAMDQAIKATTIKKEKKVCLKNLV